MDAPIVEPPASWSALYAPWIGAAFGDAFGGEAEADCARCPACAGCQTGVVPTFHPATRCCTYWPDLPNFLVGAVLARSDESSLLGRQTLTAAIAERRGATPLFIGPSPSFVRRYQRDSDSFGRVEALLCPYEAGGGCGIWASRPGTCQSWFCRSSSGMRGLRAWQSVAAWLRLLEQELASWAAFPLLDDGARLALTDPAGQPRTGWSMTLPASADGTLSDEFYHRCWGDWCGKEETFYRTCAERVAALSPSEVLAIGGPPAERLAWRVRSLLAERTVPPPDTPLFPALAGVDLHFEETEDGGVEAAHVEAIYQPLKIDGRLWAALRAFEGGIPSGEGLQVGERWLPLAEVRRLWSLGLLASSDETCRPEQEPVKEDDLLFLPSRRSIAFRRTRSAEGRPQNELWAGAACVRLEDGDLAQLAERLTLQRTPVRASALALELGMAWERAETLLTLLLQVGILGRLHPAS